MAVWRAVVTISHSSLGGTGTNTWHFRTVAEEADAIPQINDAMAAVNQLYDACGQIFPTDVLISFDGSVVGVGDDEGRFQEGFDWTAVGTNTAAVLPPSQAIVIGWTGASGDRSKRGRTFLGPLSDQTLQSNGTPTAAALTDVRIAASALIASSAEENNWAIGVWSRQEGLLRDFVGSKVNNKFASLRSRRD